MMMDLAGDGEQTQYPVVGGGLPQGLLPDDDTLSLSFLNSNSPLQHHEHAAMMADGGTPTTTLPPHRVDHTYRDFSNFPLEELPTRKRAPSNFLSKLHQILSNPEYAHIISWMPHGRAWKIHNKELLIRDIVPLYFVQSKYESFTRQLNGWGFKRLHQAGNDFNAFYHECFLKGLPHLTVLMKRVPPNQGKLLPYVEGEPNFYDIEQQYPLPPRPPARQQNNINNRTMMGMMAPYPSFGRGPASAGMPGGYVSGFSPYQAYHSASANTFPPFYPVTNTMTFPPPDARGGFQQGGNVFGEEPGPFLAAATTPGQQMMGGLCAPPPPSYSHSFMINNPSVPLMHHQLHASTTVKVAAPPTADSARRITIQNEDHFARDDEE